MADSKSFFNKQQAADIVKGIIQWVTVTALGFLYWMFVLLLASVFLMNLWHVQFETILKYAIALTVITGIVYAIVMVRRARNR